MNSCTTNPVSTLDDVLAYRHSGVIRRYMKEHEATQQEAEEVFLEMLKYLYLSYRGMVDGPEPFACMVSVEIEKIDWMWHAFLLFTVDYAGFCDRYFGFFLHHIPNEAEDEEPIDEAAFRATIERQFGLVYDVLGEKTLTTWYDECRYAAAV